MKTELKPNKLRALLGGHPWILDASLQSPSEVIPNGSVVDVYTDKNRFFARGFYNQRSKIRVRLYTWNEEEPIDRLFWERKLSEAITLRQHLGYWTVPSEDTSTPTITACRLVNSEGDGLSGLIVDQYGSVVVVQVTSLGIAQSLDQIIPVLQQLTGAKTILIRTEDNIARKEGIFQNEKGNQDGSQNENKDDTVETSEVKPSEPANSTAGWYDGRVVGQPLEGPILIDSGGIIYQIDFSEGQKTGFYLDQRENRAAAGQLFKGRTVLDMFCYHGGFSLAACKAGAVHSIACDSSRKALDQTLVNARLNNIEGIEVRQGDSFEILQSYQAQSMKFGGLVLDPPKFALGKKSVQEALRGYHFLNRLGISLVEPGGFLVTCSCTGAVSREDFFSMIHGAAQQAGRTVQVIQQRGAAMDHPVSAACPEGEYLKCFLCRVV